MGLAASVNVGNTTSSMVTNSTSNEQLINVTNVVSIRNSMHQASALVANSENLTSINTVFRQTLKMTNSTIEITGNNNEVNLNNITDAKQQAKILGKLAGLIKHTSSLVDSVLFDIAVNGVTRQQSEMTSGAETAKVTELEASGLGSFAVAVGINNSVLTSVNNSIRNLFSMAVSNCLSSSTDRKSIATNITEAENIAKFDLQADQEIVIDNFKLAINGNNNVVNLANKLSSDVGTVIMSSVNTNVASTLNAVTNHTANASTSIDASQAAESKADAKTTESLSVTAVGVPAIFILIAIIVGGVLLGKGLAAAKSSNNDSKSQELMASAMMAAQDAANKANAATAKSNDKK